MAQKMLFGNMKKGSRREDNELLKKARPKKVEPVTVITGDAYKDIVIRARSMSRRILSDILPRLELVTDEERFKQYLKKIIANKKYALDTETGGLLTYKDGLAGICLYTPGEKGIYVPTGHLSQLTRKLAKGQLTKETVRAGLKLLVRRKIDWVGHNCKFEMNVCYWNLGVTLNSPAWDTQVASVLLNENESHNLKYQYNKYVKNEENGEIAKFNELFNGIPFPLIPMDVGYMYAAFDGIQTYELYLFQKPFLTEDSDVCKEYGLQRVAKVFHSIEMPMINVLFHMEKRGIKIDPDFMSELKVRFTAKMEQAEQKFLDEVEEYRNEIDDLEYRDYALFRKLATGQNGKATVSIGSSTQLAILLYDIIGLDAIDHKKPRATGVEVLSQIDLPIAKIILEYRKFSKLVSTYLDMDKFQANNDGRVHTNYNQNGARTGRLSSDKPNLQNIPVRTDEGKLIRQVFIASDNMYLVGSDFSQQEPRILAYMSNDASMIQAYKEGKDLYATIGASLYNLPYEDCLEFYLDENGNKKTDENGVVLTYKEGKKRRSNVKSVLLGIMYGRQSKSIAEQMKVSVKEAQKVILTFYETFPKVAEFVNSVQDLAISEGYVETLGGRKCRLPDMMLDTYEFEYIDESKSASFDPLDFSGSQNTSTQVPESVIESYWNELDRAWGFKKKQEIISRAKQEGIRIKDNGGKIAEAERQCLNSVIQGGAALMTKYAMVKVYEDKELNELGFNLLVPVHDELIGECPKENASRCAERLSEVMIESGQFFVDTLPMKCDPEISERWNGESVA